ncbi:MAG: VPLPA-CTERM-specific exosortase XrtD [Pseudomonadota bacterium]
MRTTSERSLSAAGITPGLLWLMLASFGATIVLFDGVTALLAAWRLPEYSHGPLIPLISLALFLRQLRDAPAPPEPNSDRGPGIAVILLALASALLGKLAGMMELVAYAAILWSAGLILVCFGWRAGKRFWPPVLHLGFMLPLPGVLYYKLSNALQLLSAEIGVWGLQLLTIPVFLDGTIIDLGVYRLHVAEACSGLRYLFPILSFSYLFAVLYQGPAWHRAVLIAAALPLTIAMNALRITVAGAIVNTHGVEWVQGATHFFEGWVIFLACIAVLLALAWALSRLRRDSVSLVSALDLELSGLLQTAARVSQTAPSRALKGAALLSLMAAAAGQIPPSIERARVDRIPFALFPHQLGAWHRVGAPARLSPRVEAALGAQDYLAAGFQRAEDLGPTTVFIAWYADQRQGGVHSPEICLPGAGWEIAALERATVPQAQGTAPQFSINRAIVQRGSERQVVFYWFEQRGRRIAWDVAAKAWLLVDAIKKGRTDGALVRLSTTIEPGETAAEAALRLEALLEQLLRPLPRHLGTGYRPTDT